jgi:hypothetical protein
MSILGFLKDLFSPAPPIPPTDYLNSTANQRIYWVNRVTSPRKRETKSYLDKNGYLRFKDSDKLVHRYLMEKRIGRKLKIWEVVHHKDGNKCNNNPNNLLVCGWDDHDTIHRTNMLLYNNWHTPKGI